MLVQAKASFAAEVASAEASGGSWSAALRQLAQRRLSLASAKPFLAAIIAVGQSYIYTNGTLVYIVNRTIRILDLDGSSSTEQVVSMRDVLDVAVPETLGTRRYKLYLLHFANDIVSCRYTHANPDIETWLLFFSISGKWARSHRLESFNKLFVRNNQDYLYFGTYSSAENRRQWILSGFDLRREKWFDRRVHLPDMIGSEMDNNVSFEILDNYFYGISNQTHVGYKGGDWLSFYRCFRFPVSDPTPEATQVPSRASLWRRLHEEGALDDRWTSLRLERDQVTGEIIIVESRKEWLFGKSSARRTYYKQPLTFLKPGEIEAEDVSVERSRSEDDAYPGRSSTTRAGFVNGGASQGGNLSALSESVILSRDPHNVHPGDDSSKILSFTIGNTIIRSYYPAASVWLDLVNDPLEQKPGARRLRIRAGSRRLRANYEQVKSNEPWGNSHYPEEEISRIFETNDVSHWPPDQHPDSVDPRLDELHNILNPPGYEGDIRGTWGHNGLIYATSSGEANSMKLIVFLSFDSRIRLKGTKSWWGHPTGKGPSGALSPRDSPEHADGMPISQGKGKMKADTAEDGNQSSCRLLNESIHALPSWCHLEEAMYTQITSGIRLFPDPDKN
jgi:hypothetical protein